MFNVIAESISYTCMASRKKHSESISYTCMASRRKYSESISYTCMASRRKHSESISYTCMASRRKYFPQIFTENCIHESPTSPLPDTTQTYLHWKVWEASNSEKLSSNRTCPMVCVTGYTNGPWRMNDILM